MILNQAFLFSAYSFEVERKGIAKAGFIYSIAMFVLARVFHPMALKHVILAVAFGGAALNTLHVEQPMMGRHVGGKFPRNRESS